MDSVTVAKRILDEVNVAVIPGEGFGADEYIRLSFATSIEQIKEGTKRLKSWIKNLSSNLKTSFVSHE
jgi:aspartate aminotransferase